MLKIKYIDTISYGNMHLQFNASLLYMCSIVADEVIYFANKSCKKKVYQLLSGIKLSNVTYKNILMVRGVKRINIALRLIWGALQNVYYLLSCKRTQVLIYNYNNLLSLFLINLLNWRFKRKVLICCHGEMEMLLCDKYQGGPLVRLQTWLCKKFYLSPHRKSSLFFMVMGESILSNIKELVNPCLYSRFLSVDHAYIFNESKKNKENLSCPISIGTVGVLHALKGMGLLCELADRLETKNRQDIQLSVTGRIFGSIQPLKERNISLPSNEGIAPVDIEEFESRINTLDYILFLYPMDSYKLTASGAILEALSNNKPIIALRNEYFEYLFEKYGQLGYLLGGVEELVLLINNLVASNNVFSSIDFDKIKKRLSPQTVAISFRAELSRIGYC